MTRDRSDTVLYDLDLNVDPQFTGGKVAPDRVIYLMVIDRARFDALTRPQGVSAKDIADAHDFFYDGRLEIYCHYCDQNPHRLRRIYERDKKMMENGGKLRMAMHDPSRPSLRVPADDEDWLDEPELAVA